MESREGTACSAQAAGGRPEQFTVHAARKVTMMTETLHDDTGVVTEQTCGICLEESKDPLNLPCGHLFCDGCLDEWRSRYGVKQEMRRKCPTCRATIPPSKEMVAALKSYRAAKQELEDNNDRTSQQYHNTCRALEQAEERVGQDWDGVTVLQYKNDNPPLVMPEYIFYAMRKGDIESVLKWIYDNRTEDSANAVTGTEMKGMPAVFVAAGCNHLTLMSLLLQLGANVDVRDNQGCTVIGHILSDAAFAHGKSSPTVVRLLLSWGASFFADGLDSGCSGDREDCISQARNYGRPDLANLLGSELGGRRCEIVNLPSRLNLNGKTCVADEYLPHSNQYKVTLETKSKDVLLIRPDNLMRRDRTPQDCGYYIEFKNGRAIRHDFESSEDCQVFVAALNKDQGQQVVMEETEA